MGLVSLKISNFAIINNIDVKFLDGFTVMTGETGAGKSIIIDALSLALGEKATPAMIRSGADTAEIECQFLAINPDHPVFGFLAENQIQAAEWELTLRRELNVNGRSRAWINDTPCTVSVLKTVGDLLVDLHGQHDHQSLLKEENHIQFLDAFGGYRELLEKVHDSYLNLQHLNEKLTLWSEKRKLNQEKRELWEFQLNEINQIDPHEGEYEELLKEKSILENVEKIHLIAEELKQILYQGDENTVYQQLLSAVKKLTTLNNITPDFSEELSSLEEAQFLVQEIANHLATYSDDLRFDPNRLETVNKRLYSLQQLMKKYGATLPEVLAYKAQVQHNLSEDDGLDVEISKTTRQFEKQRLEYEKIAIELSQSRKHQAVLLETQIATALTRLGLTGSQFKIEIKQLNDIKGWVQLGERRVRGNSDGIDNVAFEISTNPGEPLRSLVNIVSGGEVSRIMLAMKSILAGKDHVPVVIFDEIDTGISGKIAQVVGYELKSLAEVRQVICITHLPQIAGLGEHHYQVYKVSDNGRNYTRIAKLSAEERVEEIAALIGGNLVTETTRQQARELIKAGS
jgi:DNA repair protein RecN (Recombination protein N)